MRLMRVFVRAREKVPFSGGRRGALGGAQEPRRGAGEAGQGPERGHDRVQLGRFGALQQPRIHARRLQRVLEQTRRAPACVDGVLQPRRV